MNSLSGDNNLVPFQQWGRETLPKWGKVPQYFVQDLKSVITAIAISEMFHSHL